MSKQPRFIEFKIVVALVTSLFLYVIFNKSPRNSRKIDYLLEKKTYKLLVADSPQEWERGLMFYRQLDHADGMIFVFPDGQYRTFWNKNTYLDLDLIWLSDDSVVGKGFLPSIEKSRKVVTASSPVRVNKVIELKR